MDELSNHMGNVLAVISDRGELQSTQDYYPFGMAMPGRSSGSYRYGFNGKETDAETGIQDYGMRWNLPNIARFPSVDPLYNKFPNESPYIFCSNNPLIYTDTDGLEKIIVIGGGDGSANDRQKFINTGLLQLKNYIDKTKGSCEPITIIVNNKFLDDAAYKTMIQFVKAYNQDNNAVINIIKTESGAETTNYINSKSTQATEISDARMSDKITDISFFSHGYRAECSSQDHTLPSLEPGHGTPHEEMSTEGCNGPEHERWAWGVNDINRIDPKAFGDNANCDFYSCNPGTPNKTGESLLSYASKKIPQAKFTGLWGRSDYSKIYEHLSLSERMFRKSNGGVYPATKLPSEGNKSGEPEGVKSEKVSYQNGKK